MSFSHTLHAIILASTLAGATCLGAAGGGGFSLDRSVVASGGGTMTGATFSLQGTIGQPVVGQTGGAVFTLTAGYWTGAGAEETCLADFNNDGIVNSGDFFDFLAAFGAGDADVNGDGTTNSADFFDFLAAFNAGC